jgi:hypothetical protein
MASEQIALQSLTVDSFDGLVMFHNFLQSATITLPQLARMSVCEEADLLLVTAQNFDRLIGRLWEIVRSDSIPQRLSK